MNNQLAKIEFSEDNIKLIKAQIAPKATDNELKLFLYQAQRTGLDPLARQIYAIHRWMDGSEKMVIQTSIDGFRIVAERSGNYAGQSEPEFVMDGNKLVAAKIRVYKFRGENRYEAAVGVAYFDEYKQVKKDGQLMSMWGKMPFTMLAKCAEALALRKAFPQDLSGLYTGDEMEQSDEPAQQATVVSTTLPAKKKLSDKAFTQGMEKAKADHSLLDRLENEYTLNDEQIIAINAARNEIAASEANPA